MVVPLLTLILLALLPPQEDALLLRHATLLPMTATMPQVLEDHAVVIRGDSIVWVGPDAQRPQAPGAREVDLTGRFVMPGLTDMHVHLSESYLPLFLANGVTTVRELNGSPDHLALRQRIRAGTLAGPRMFVSSPLLTGQSWSVRHVIVPGPDSAGAVVAAMARDGYDWIKVYDGLSRATYTALMAAARQHALPVTGHIPDAVGLDGVLAARQDLEHVEKLAWVTGGMDPDPTRVAEVAGAVAAAGVRLTPTLWSQGVMTAQGTTYYDELFERPEMRYVSEGTKGWWASLRRTPPMPVDPASRGARMHAYQKALVLALHRAGVPLLLGTDTPNPLLVPGFSIHDEIGALVDAGIPVHEVLRMGTSTAARALGMETRLGVIAVGAAADLVVSAGNPLVEPATLRKPVAVLAAGRLYDRAALDGLLAAAVPGGGE